MSNKNIYKFFIFWLVLWATTYFVPYLVAMLAGPAGPQVFAISEQVLYILSFAAILLLLYCVFWSMKWNRLLNANQYDESLLMAEKATRGLFFRNEYRKSYALTLLYAGQIQQAAVLAEEMLRQKDGMAPTRKNRTEVYIYDIALFLLGREQEWVKADERDLWKSEKITASYLTCKMIETYMAGTSQEVLTNAELLRTRMRFCTCVSALVLCLEYHKQGDALKMAFYKQQALETATSEELRQLAAQRLAGIAQDHTG